MSCPDVRMCMRRESRALAVGKMLLERGLN